MSNSTSKGISSKAVDKAPAVVKMVEITHPTGISYPKTAEIDAALRHNPEQEVKDEDLLHAEPGAVIPESALPPKSVGWLIDQGWIRRVPVDEPKTETEVTNG